jgi:hypothetical protein
MSVRHQRKRQNQRIFRAANERLQHTIDGQVPFGTVLPFLCECADDRCRGRIDMDASDYEGIHIDRQLYIVIRDHPTMDGEDVVEEQDDYDIVRKAVV